jgi:hypothetical protein
VRFNPISRPIKEMVGAGQLGDLFYYCWCEGRFMLSRRIGFLRTTFKERHGH